MALYELRTYTLYVGKMAEAVKLYQELGFPALKKGGHDKNLVGYFQGDTGMINQLVHLWKFEDDADRRAHWEAVFANTDFDSVRRGEPGQLQRMNKASRPSGWFDRRPCCAIGAHAGRRGS